MTLSNMIQMKVRARLFFRVQLPIILFVIGLIVGYGCRSDGGHDPVNVAPTTRLSNLPPPQDTITTSNPRLTLNWIGDDPDGFVTGFRYRWSYRLTEHDPFLYKSYKIILNIIVKRFALLAVTENPEAVPAVYKYFATLPPEGLDAAQTNSLARGDSIHIEGVRVYAANSDSIRIPTTGQRVGNGFPVHINPNSGTFIFDSQDSLNFHTFEVAAIDNNGAVSNVPAYVSFRTPRVSPPHVEVVPPFPEDTSFVLEKTTDTFLGIQFYFKGFDPNSRTIDYSWVVDKDQYPPNQIPWSEWSPSEQAFVTAGDFPPGNHEALNHTFYVRARNEFGSIDTLGYFLRGRDTIFARRSFRTILPEFQKPNYSQKILFLNNSFDSLSTGPSGPDRQMIDDYYSGLFDELGKNGRYSIWRVFKDNPPGGEIPFPGYTELSKYSLVVVCGDRGDFQRKVTPAISSSREKILRDYCYIGGNIIFSGWTLTSPVVLPRIEEFYSGVLHLALSPPFGIREFVDSGFVGARGSLGYPDLYLDSAKLAPSWRGSLDAMRLCFPKGFGEIIYTFDSKYNAPSVEGAPFGVRYIGVTFNSVFLNFPLYYMERSQAVSFLRKALQDIGEY